MFNIDKEVPPTLSDEIREFRLRLLACRVSADGEFCANAKLRRLYHSVYNALAQSSVALIDGHLLNNDKVMVNQSIESLKFYLLKAGVYGGVHLRSVYEQIAGFREEDVWNGESRYKTVRFKLVIVYRMLSDKR